MIVEIRRRAWLCVPVSSSDASSLRSAFEKERKEMEKYGAGDVVDLDDVAISSAAFSSWQRAAEVGARTLALAKVNPARIPIEQGLVLKTGELEIFVEIPGLTRISMKIPPGEWQFR